jgi:hypothetical protein
MLLRMSRGKILFGFAVGGQLGQDRDEPLSEGRLLLGQDSRPLNGDGGLPAADRQIVIRAAR